MTNMPVTYGVNPAVNPYHMTPTQGMQRPANANPSPAKTVTETDGFDDFQTAKSTAPQKPVSTLISDIL
jgi:hypothetical protein